MTSLFNISQIAVKIPLVLFLYIILGRLILNVTLKETVFYMVVAYSIILFCDIFVALIGIIFGAEIGSGATYSVMHMITAKILYVILIVLTQKILYGIGTSNIRVKSLILFLLSNLGYFVVTVVLMVNIANYQDDLHAAGFLSCAVIIFLALVANLIFSDKYIQLENKEQKQLATIYELQYREKYYESKLREEEKIKKIYHDIKNHLLLIEGMDENLSVLTKKIRKDIIQYEDYFRTGNKFLDIILKDKKDKANSFHISFEDNLDMSKALFIQAIDLSTIFGNLLDNAIEACSSLPIEERYIKVQGKREKGFLIISIRNSKAYNNVNKCKKKIISGYGLINVKNAVERYDGVVNISDQETEFIVNIIIPLENSYNNKRKEEENQCIL